MIHLEKRFAPRDYSVIVPYCAPHGERSPFRRAPGNASQKFPGLNVRSLIKTSGSVCRPMRRPVRGKADPLAAIGAREIEKIVVLAEPQFVLGVAAQGDQPSLCFRARAIQVYRLLKFGAGLVSFSRRSPRPHFHILWRARRLAIHDPHCRVPVLRLRILPYFCLPVRSLLLSPNPGTQ